MKTFWQSNTIRVALAAILASWAAFFGGELGIKEAVAATVAAVIAIFMRRGQGVSIGAILIAVALTVGCAGSPANTSPAMQGAQTLTGQQGQAAETGSATTYANPTILNLFGVKKLKLSVGADGIKTIETESEGAGEFVVEGSLTLPGIHYGEESATSEVSSGGGSAAGTSGTTITPKPEPVKPTP